MALRTLADGRQKVTIFTERPESPDALSVADLESAIDASCDLAKNGTRFSATASDTISDPRLCDEANVNALGASNYEVNMAVFWLLEADGSYEPESNPVYEAAREKGTLLWAALREGKKAGEAWASGDHYELYEFTVDNAQRPTETGGYLKRIIPGQGQRIAEGEVAA